MSFPFTLIGNFIYLVYASAILVILVLPLWKWLLKEKVWKWWLITPVTLSLLIAPIAEELWIEYHFETLCKDAGIHVKRKVEAEGYLKSIRSSVTSSMLKEGPIRKELYSYEKQGFKFYETLLRDGKIKHLKREGQWVILSILEKPKARYHLLHTHNHFKVGHQLTKMQRIILDKEQNKIISRDTKYARYPGFIDGLWIRLLGDGQNICYGSHPGKSKLRNNLLSYTLTPALND